MHGFAGKRFSWLLAGSAQLDPYVSALATYAAPLAPATAAQTLPEKMEVLIDAAYAQGDRETGRHLTGVLDSLHRRTGRSAPGTLSWLGGHAPAARIPPLARRRPGAAPANDP